MCHYCWDRGATLHIVVAEKFLGWGTTKVSDVEGPLKTVSQCFLRWIYLGKWTVFRPRYGQKLSRIPISLPAPLNDPTELTLCSSFGTMKNMGSIETLLAGPSLNKTEKLHTNAYVSMLTGPTVVVRISA